MARTYPKCATCGHPLPIKPDPALPNEAGRRPNDPDETRVLLACVLVLAAAVMAESLYIWWWIL